MKVSLSPSSSVFVTHVLSSSSFGLEFIADDPPALQQFNLALRHWCRHLLGWPRASPVAAVHWKLGTGDALHLAFRRAFSLFGRLCAVDHASPHFQCVPTFFVCAANLVRVCSPLQLQPTPCPRGYLSWLSALVTPPMAFREVYPRLHRALRRRLFAMVSDLHGVLVDVSSDNFLPVRDNPVDSFNLRPSRHRQGPSAMTRTAPSCIIFLLTLLTATLELLGLIPVASPCPMLCAGSAQLGSSGRNTQCCGTTWDGGWPVAGRFHSVSGVVSRSAWLCSRGVCCFLRALLVVTCFLVLPYSGQNLSILQSQLWPGADHPACALGLAFTTHC